MTLFRPASLDDVSAIAAFTSKAASGLTTVPKTEETVGAYITESMKFIGGDDSANRLLFVVERDGKVAGISGIIPRLGVDRPFYSFKKSRHARKASKVDLSVRYETLQLTTDFDDYTELATMFIAPESRGQGIARLLSYGRLGFIQNHRRRFNDRLMAEIRGWFDENENSPFWDHLASKYIQTDFKTADELSNGSGEFMIELLPALPILLNLLPQSVRDCAGKPHHLSAGAMKLLMTAGFEDTDICDIFDGGPAVQCRTDKTLIAQTVYQATGGGVETSDHKYLHFTGQNEGFRAAMGPAYPGAEKAGKEPCDILGTITPKVALAQDRKA
ncbi:arginine N-succinyltransferase [Litorimonas sp. WD9-15]|uniref:arginine N-succinyltransferase n=1 Tax=Litorimonas sp. WD9-15 TaxID=3418716 RepID=UPI003D05DD0D